MRKLTDVQLETLKLLAEGLTSLQIAERRFVSRNTVDSTLNDVFERLNLKGRKGARRIRAVNILRNHELGELESKIARYRTALQWASAAPAFQESGEAREGWLKVCQPLLQANDHVNATTCYCAECTTGCLMCGLRYHADDVDRQHYGGQR